MHLSNRIFDSEEMRRYRLLSPETLFELVDLHVAIVRNALLNAVELQDMLNVLHGSLLGLFRIIWNIHLKVITSENAHKLIPDPK